MDHDTAANVAQYNRAVANFSDEWVIGCGGLEEPFIGRDGRRYVYVYNPYFGEHGMLDMETDIVIDDMEYYGVN